MRSLLRQPLAYGVLLGLALSMGCIVKGETDEARKVEEPAVEVRPMDEEGPFERLGERMDRGAEKLDERLEVGAERFGRAMEKAGQNLQETAEEARQRREREEAERGIDVDVRTVP